MCGDVNLLLVEEDPTMRHIRSGLLRRTGLYVTEVSTAEELTGKTWGLGTDIIILVTPAESSTGRYISSVRKIIRGQTVPLIVLSTTAGEFTAAEALDAGADDFMAIPAGLTELRARIRALTRRIAVSYTVIATDSICGKARFSDVIVDTREETITRGGQLIHMTRNEYRLLLMLIHARGKSLHRETLLTALWGAESVRKAHYLRNYIFSLRKKLEPKPSFPEYILTDLQYGYRLAGIKFDDLAD